MSEELKPCPFCGSKCRIERGGIRFRVACTHILKCGATQYWFDTEIEAITAWNTRADGWISVDERLPITFENVLVTVNGVGRTICHRVPNQKGPWYDLHSYNHKNVTHWQPLPKAPSEPKGAE